MAGDVGWVLLDFESVTDIHPSNRAALAAYLDHVGATEGTPN